MKLRLIIVVKGKFIRIFTFLLVILILFSISGILTSLNLMQQNYPEVTILNHSMNILNTPSRSREGYSYHNYSTLVSDLQKLNTNYSHLMELYTTQELYGLPDCTGGYKIWVVRITTENLGLDKPEVLFLGGHHGNEAISIEAPYYLIEYMVQNYATNASIRYLIDQREIYVIPVLNPWGWENNIREDSNGEDVNRDYPYGIESGNTPLTTIGARSVTELMKEHLFVLSLSWHSGDHLIYYAWGTPEHDTSSDESPDNIAFFEVANLLSDHAGGTKKYATGPANQMFSYGAYGAWSDYAYAAAWDTDYVFSGFENSFARSLAIGIEISNTKAPDEALLGDHSEVSMSNGNIGLVSQNIRMAIVFIDLVEPYVSWQNSSIKALPVEIETNSNITLNWTVGGSFSVTDTNLFYGTDPDPVNNYQNTTTLLSGASHWSGEVFTQTFTAPASSGDYYFVAHAVVDQSSLVQVSPEPDVKPQSFFVNQRTNDNWTIENKNNTLTGSKEWFSSIIHLKVVPQKSTTIRFNERDENAYCNEPYNISWEIKTIHQVNSSSLYWSSHPDPRNQPEIIEPAIQTKDNQYFTNFTLPSRPGYYYFTVESKLYSNSTNTSKQETDHWSKMVSIEVIPRKPYELLVNIQEIDYTNELEQKLSVTGITCINSNISDFPLNDSLMIENKATIRPIPIDFKNDTGPIPESIVFELVWSEADGYWKLPIINVSTFNSNWYIVVCEFTHKYGVGKSMETIGRNNWFNVKHIITISNPELKIIAPENNSLSILNVTATSSKNQIGLLTESNSENHNYTIYDQSNDNIMISGNLTWSIVTNTWQAKNIDLSDFESGVYFVVCEFSVPKSDSQKRIQSSSNPINFTFESGNDQRLKDGKDSDSNIEIFIAVFVLVLVLLVIIVLFKLKIIGKKR
jgi:hypothetical protein